MSLDYNVNLIKILLSHRFIFEELFSLNESIKLCYI